MNDTELLEALILMLSEWRADETGRPYWAPSLMLNPTFDKKVAAWLGRYPHGALLMEADTPRAALEGLVEQWRRAGAIARGVGNDTGG